MGHQHKADIILHPVRLRILVALGGTKLTAQQLVRLLPDVPQTTLYRQLNLLTRHGVLEVAEERRVRGTVERVYRPAPGTTTLTPGDLAEALLREESLDEGRMLAVTGLQGRPAFQNPIAAAR